MPETKKRIGILISGRGSNMLALADAVRDGRIPDADIALVISNVADAAGLTKAAARGIAIITLDHRGKTHEQHDQAMAAALREARVDVVCLAGYMRLLSPWFTNEFKGRVLNIHPSLLPAFPGLHGARDALSYGVKFTGCTVHLVDEHLDHGPILKQAVVPVFSNDTEDSLSARILVEEHRIYAEAVAMLLHSDWRIEGRSFK
ncbi:MAG: phosphoribosylglycinamide formyltransferase [Acidobacteria bacterium]|nr:phosphoribosylglycinamide formyltransferase [Acidobacteriota bacterium]